MLFHPANTYSVGLLDRRPTVQRSKCALPDRIFPQCRMLIWLCGLVSFLVRVELLNASSFGCNCGCEPMVSDITFFVSVRWSPTGSYLMAVVNSLAG